MELKTFLKSILQSFKRLINVIIYSNCLNFDVFIAILHTFDLILITKSLRSERPKKTMKNYSINVIAKKPKRAEIPLKTYQIILFKLWTKMKTNEFGFLNRVIATKLIIDIFADILSKINQSMPNHSKQIVSNNIVNNFK